MRVGVVVLVAACLLAACRTFAYETFDGGRKSAPRSILEQRARLNEPVTKAQLSWKDVTVAVRHRRLLAPPLLDSITKPIGSLFAAPTAPVATVVAPAVADNAKLVVEAWIELMADDVAKAAADVGAQVVAAGGRVVSSNIEGTDRNASSAALELRVPPARATGFLTWLGSIGEVQSRRTLASDVGKIMFDQQLELTNLELTMTRLQKLVEKDVPIKELLEIEREMTRVRGEIERVKGEQRWLSDRVELATITLTITREGGVDPSPHARVYPGARLATLVLFDPEGRPRTRLGGGGALHVKRWLTIDLDVFPRKDGDSRAVIATIGAAIYSGYLGFGRRRFFDPFLGVRAGYGYLSGEGATVLAAELGIELYKHRYLRIETSARAVAFLRERQTDGALHATLGIAVPF